MKDARGKCLCGAVKFEATGVETGFHACHCAMCRRWSGGAPLFCTSVESVTFSGEDNLGRYTSSEWAERGFCRVCGTTLFYFLKPTKRYSFSIGAFDDADSFAIEREIFIDAKPAGYALAGDHPRLTEREVLAEHGL